MHFLKVHLREKSKFASKERKSHRSSQAFACMSDDAKMPLSFLAQA